MKEKIGQGEFFSLLAALYLTFPVMFGLCQSLGQDAWMGSIIPSGVGILFLFIYLGISKKTNYCNFIEIFTNTYGKRMGKIIGVLYALYFLLNGNWAILSTVVFIKGILLQSMPSNLILFGILSLFLYVLSKKFEAFSRVGATLSIWTIGVMIFVLFLLFSSGAFKIANVLPFFEHSWDDIIKESYPEAFVRPFGNGVLILFLVPMLSSRKKLTRRTIGAVVLFSILLMITIFFTAGVVGGEMMKLYTYPILMSAEKVIIFDFIHRIDIVVIFFMLLSVFTVTLFYLFSSLYVGCSVSKKINEDYIIIFIILLTFVGGVTMVGSYGDTFIAYINIRYIQPYIDLPFAYGIPLLTYIVLLIKGWKKPKVKQS